MVAGKKFDIHASFEDGSGRPRLFKEEGTV
jgi:hypothetical protein